jgi:hypothetical protein
MPQGIPMPMPIPMSAVPMTTGMALPFGFPAMMPYPVGVQVPAAAAGLKVGTTYSIGRKVATQWEVCMLKLDTV